MIGVRSVLGLRLQRFMLFAERAENRSRAVGKREWARKNLHYCSAADGPQGFDLAHVNGMSFHLVTHRGSMLWRHRGPPGIPISDFEIGFHAEVLVGVLTHRTVDLVVPGL